MSLKIQNKTLFVISLILIIVMIEPVFADRIHSNYHTNHHHSGHSHQHTDGNEMTEEVMGK